MNSLRVCQKEKSRTSFHKFFLVRNNYEIKKKKLVVVSRIQCLQAITIPDNLNEFSEN